MTLIKSISGIRGTLGNKAGNNLTPIDIVESTAGFGAWIQKRKNTDNKVVIGRDGRISGNMVNNLVANTLIAMGIDVIDLGLTTTPTVEIAVTKEIADAGIVITASHNPKQWNALKFLNNDGEFISAADGQEILDYIDSGDIMYAEVDNLGTYEENNNYNDIHIDDILALDIIDVEKIRSKNFTIAVDTINSTGSIILPQLFAKLNCEAYFINDIVNGEFAHNPEPLPENLSELSELVLMKGADIGIAVDPDVDRLALVSEDGSMFGEEYTLVAAADFILSKNIGNTVSNLSSTRALRDITEAAGGEYFAAAVGEVNVVTKMKEVNAVIGGEGNGGVIYPGLHYGRDAILGIVMILNLLADKDVSLSDLKHSYPKYYMAKKKISLNDGINVDALLDQFHSKYSSQEVDTQDGVKIYFDEPVKQWVHLRKSNTEPIIRVYTESNSLENAEKLGDRFVDELKNIM